MQPQAAKRAGPGAIQQSDVSPIPLLQGATEYEYVTLLNPLSVDFVGLVGITKPVNVPFEISKSPNTQQITTTESDVARNYGLNLKNADFQGRTNIVNEVYIPSGKTINLLGSEAQVICRQLVNEIMQREKMSLQMYDPVARNEVEKRVIITRKSVNDILGRGPMTVQDQLKAAVETTNKDINNERAFPTIIRPTEPDLDSVISSVATDFATNNAVINQPDKQPVERTRAKTS